MGLSRGICTIFIIATISTKFIITAHGRTLRTSILMQLLLASKDVFLSLSMQKIKTLKQAEELLKTNNNPKIKNVVDQYRSIHEKVFESMNDKDRLVDFSCMNL
jgi:hypothetical protein